MNLDFPTRAAMFSCGHLPKLTSEVSWASPFERGNLEYSTHMGLLGVLRLHSLTLNSPRPLSCLPLEPSCLLWNLLFQNCHLSTETRFYPFQAACLLLQPWALPHFSKSCLPRSQSIWQLEGCVLIGLMS